MTKSLVPQILAYMHDTDARYAIALEGDWGSGKTRFCETRLKAALEEEDYTLLRVSLAGIYSVDDFYTRLAMSLVHLGNSESDSSGRKLAKSIGTLIFQGGISFSKKVLGDQGVTIEATPQMLASALGKTQLLVLDDFERSGFCSKQTSSVDAQQTDLQTTELFGAINSLVDGQDCKVMFVTNDFSGISTGIREKLVWKCLRFDPKPEDLAKAIIVPKLGQVANSLDFDVAECVRRASVKAGCTNARAMIKATGLIKMACASNAARNPKVDKGNRQDALEDFARFALLAAMGQAPERPATRQEGTHFDYEQGQRLAIFEQYKQLDIIDSFFSAKKNVSPDDVNVCLTRYITSRYAGTPETMNLKRLLDKMPVAQYMDDEDVAKLATDLSHCILYTEFNLSYLVDAVQANWTLRTWGFDEAIDSDKLLTRAKELTDNDPENAYRGVHGKFLLWSDEWKDRFDGLITVLDAYAVEAYMQLKNESIMRDIIPDDPKAGERVADTITIGWSHGEDAFLDFDPKLIANSFINGDARSQIALYKMSMGLEDRAVFYKEERARLWATSLLTEMRDAEPRSRMGSRRQAWTIEVLEKLVADISGTRVLPQPENK